jgi:hypothetical protein
MKLWIGAAFVLLLICLGLTFGIQTSQDQSNKETNCCFANPKYSGICSVTLAEGETCQTILDYLNNPNSSGKTYCDSTPIRIGWKQVKCQKTQPPEGGQ